MPYLTTKVLTNDIVSFEQLGPGDYEFQGSISMEVCSAFSDAKQKGIFAHKDIEGSDQTIKLHMRSLTRTLVVYQLNTAG